MLGIIEITYKALDSLLRPAIIIVYNNPLIALYIILFTIIKTRISYYIIRVFTI